jgi:glucose/arabinose dehydrogenase
MPCDADRPKRGIVALAHAALAAALCPAGAVADPLTNREAAVAVDRIPIPAPDNVVVELVAGGLHLPWSLAFLPDGRLLVSEKPRGLRIVAPDRSVGPLLRGGPSGVLTKEDSGFLDLALDPDFASNRMIYLAFVEGDEAANRTAIWKARLEGERLEGGQVIFRTGVAKRGPSHPGGRLLFLPDKTLLLSVGDGFDYRDAAQDPASHLGKMLRLTRDGKPPSDNPFIGRPGVAAEIWTMGHRNVQGLTLDRETGIVWSHEHGPRGGDEINLLKPGSNYGWPILSHGIDYDGRTITDRAFAAGFEPSQFYWAPSIAPSGLVVYRGDRYPDWQGRFFVGGLASRSLVRLRAGRDTGLIVEEERMLAGLRTRIRDVRAGPDGYLYLLTDETDGRLLRLVAPAAAPAVLPSPGGRSTRDLGFSSAAGKGKVASCPPSPRA